MQEQVKKFSEDKLELAIIELFKQQGYVHVLGEHIDRSFRDILLLDDLRVFILDRYADENWK